MDTTTTASNNGVVISMRKAFLKKVKKMLEKELGELVVSIDAAKKSEIDLGGAEEIELIQAQILSRSVSQLAVRNQNRVLQITNALKRIEAGSYGVCLECSEPIDERRLAINPSFFLCAGCSELAEVIRRKNGK